VQPARVGSDGGRRNPLPGVYGAQLSGAGLGGCIMILADASAAERVERTLRKTYYRPGGWCLRSASVSPWRDRG